MDFSFGSVVIQKCSKASVACLITHVNAFLPKVHAISLLARMLQRLYGLATTERVKVLNGLCEHSNTSGCTSNMLHSDQ